MSPAARLPSFALVAVVGWAMIFGGGGTHWPLAELICSLGVVLAVWLAWPRSDGTGADGGVVPRGQPFCPPAVALTIAALLIAVPLIQLIPLPPALWRALPGREPLAAALDAANLGGSWQGLTTSPPLTVMALLSLVPPLAVLLLASLVDERGRRLMWLTIAGVALVSVLLGLAQVTAPPHNPFYPYPTTQMKALGGFQANRNAQVDVLMIAMLAATAWFASFRRDREPGIHGWVMFLTAQLVFLVGALFTSSRGGIAILPATLVIQGWMLGLWGRVFHSRRVALLALAVALALGGISFAAFQHSRPLQAVFDRYSNLSDGRPDLWEDSVFSIHTSFPVGTGLGTFVPALIAVERLEVVDPSNPIHAHNEFLEFTLEAGIVGWAAVVAALALIGHAVWRGRATRDPRLRIARQFLAGTALVLFLHSFVDYPMRSMSLATLLALATGFLIATTQARRTENTA